MRKDKKWKIVLFTKDKSENSDLYKNWFKEFSDELHDLDLKFGTINLSKNELFDLQKYDIPMIALMKDEKDNEMLIYEGKVDKTQLRTWLEEEMYFLVNLEKI